MRKKIKGKMLNNRDHNTFYEIIGMWPMKHRPWLIRPRPRLSLKNIWMGMNKTDAWTFGKIL
jgi:hypothetical protein